MAISGFTGSRGSEQRTKQVFEERMESRLPYFDKVFCRDTLWYCFTARLFADVIDHSRNDWITIPDFVAVLQAMTFGLQNGSGETRKQFSSGMGLAASKFRKRFMIQALHDAKNDTFKVFSGEPLTDSASNASDRNISGHMKNNDPASKCSVLKAPPWLSGSSVTTGYIRVSDIKHGQKLHEEKNGSIMSKRWGVSAMV